MSRNVNEKCALSGIVLDNYLMFKLRHYQSNGSVLDVCYKNGEFSKFNSIQYWPFWGCLRIGEHMWGKKAPIPKICQTYSTMMKLGTVIPLTQIRSKKYTNKVTHPMSSTIIFSLLSIYFKLTNYIYIVRKQLSS